MVAGADSLRGSCALRHRSRVHDSGGTPRAVRYAVSAVPDPGMQPPSAHRRCVAVVSAVVGGARGACDRQWLPQRCRSLCFVTPYLIDDQFGMLVNGLFVLPQKRVQFAAMEMPPAQWILAGAAAPGGGDAASRICSRACARNRYRPSMLWLVGALLVVVASLYSVRSYQVIWQAARGFAALLPVAICGILISGTRSRCHASAGCCSACATFLAWASLVQLPFSAPIYFCYVTPLAVIAAVAVAGHSAALTRPAFGVSAAVLLDVRAWSA